MKTKIILILLLCFIFGSLAFADVTINTGVAGDVKINTGVAGKFTYSTLNKGLIFDMPMTSKYTQSATVLSDLANENWGTASNCTIGSTYTEFNGTTSYIDIGADKPSDLTGDITFGCWIYPETLGESGDGRLIDNGKFLVYLNNDNRISISNNGITVRYSTANSITLNTWQHILVARNGTTGVPILYVNGIGQTITAAGAPVAGSTNTFIGNNLANNRTFDGDIAQFRIWNRILTTSERTEEYLRKKSVYQP